MMPAADSRLPVKGALPSEVYPADSPRGAPLAHPAPRQPLTSPSQRPPEPCTALPVDSSSSWPAACRVQRQTDCQAQGAALSSGRSPLMGQGIGLELDHPHLMPSLLSVQQGYFFRKLVSTRLD